MVDDLKLKPFVSNIFLRDRKILHIHHEGDLGAFGRRESFQVRSFCRIKRRQFLGTLERHDILDPIDMGDGSVASGQKAATFVGIEFPGVGDHVVENVLGNDEIRHG